MRLRSFFKVIALLVFVSMAAFVNVSSANAQTCTTAATAICAEGQVLVCTLPNGNTCSDTDDPDCTCAWEPNIVINGQSCYNPLFPNSCATGCPAGTETIQSPSCYWSNTCPAGYTYCGGCINACRKTSTGTTCAAHIANECSPGNGSSCGSNGCTWCTTPAGTNAQSCPAGWEYGGTGSGGCGTLGCCCSPCEAEGFYTEPSLCGSGSCGPCEREMTKRSNSTNQFCGTICVADVTCAQTTCSPRCGQAGSCSTTCPTTDDGPPGDVLITPPNGATVERKTNGTITVSWTAADKADIYRLEIWPEPLGGPAGDCNSTGAYCDNSYTQTSYTFTPAAANGNRYKVRVRPRNNTCSSYTQTHAGNWKESVFTITAKITGRFYLDPEGDTYIPAGQTLCVDPTPSTRVQINPGTGATLEATGKDNISTSGYISDTTYTVTVPWWPPTGDNTLTLNPGTDLNGDPYVCACPTDNGSGECFYPGGIASPSNAVNFYLTGVPAPTEPDLTNGAWWQAGNANVYAAKRGGRAMQSYVPVDTCEADATCTPAVISKDAAETTDSAGIGVTGGGVVDTTDANGVDSAYLTDRDEPSPALALGTSITQTGENYDYFFREFSMGNNPSEDFAGSDSDALKPDPGTQPPANGRAYYRGGSLVIQQPWNVAAGEEIVVFVNGDLTLQDPDDAQQLIQVAPGGFLAFIVKGNILIKANVGNDDLNNDTPNVEGVYLADGTITVETIGANIGDDRFVGAGTFVGWNINTPSDPGIDLQRDFSDGGARRVENNTRPTELFIYRPDFVINAPERMTRPRYVWQETAAEEPQ